MLYTQANLGFVILTQKIRQLELFQARHNIVLWVNTPEYDKLLYASSNYEKYYNQPLAELYLDYSTWKHNIITQDLDKTIEELSTRDTDANTKRNGFFYVKGFKDEPQLIQDRCFVVKDSNNIPFFTAGISYPLESEKDMQGDLQEYHSNKLDKLIVEYYSILMMPLDIPEESLVIRVIANLTGNLSDDTKFTTREKDVFKGIIKGMSGKEIAAFLDISPRTVESHINNIKDKLNLRARSDIVSWAIENNLLSIHC